MDSVESFLATVNTVFPTESEFLPYDKENKDSIAAYNNNKTFAKGDARFYGAITYKFEDTLKIDDYAFPFDKNNFTFPISGETVVILKMGGQTYWLPYTTTPYVNYRRDYITYEATKAEDTNIPGENNTASDYRKNKDTGGTTNSSNTEKPKKETYKINEKIKFLKPKEGDTIISGRVGNTIRFSEFFLTEDGKTSSPSIFIRNKQNGELDSKAIGELVEEDINKDGTSVYITSGKVKIPFNETIKKEKIGFKGYPSSSDLSGNQLLLNSDRVILSAKAKEFIIFGKSNTGIITDGNFSVDASKEIYLHSDANVTIHSKGSNQIFLNSDSGGNIYLGKNTGAGDAGAEVQKMVLGGELVQILSDLIDAINSQSYLTPSGTSGVAPLNTATFNSIKGKLKTILSAKNYLSK